MKGGRNNPASGTLASSALSRRAIVGTAIALVAGVLAVYAQVWQFNFVTLDDPTYVPRNPQVMAGLTPASIRWAFTRVHDSNWIPLTWLSLMLDSEIFRGHPGGYHVTNLLLHGASTVLLFLIFVAGTGAIGRSAVVAALFGLHPLHVESVAWVAERKDVLSIFYGMISLWLYVRSVKRGGRGGIASWVFFVLSLMSKQTLVTLPFVLLLLDFWPLGRLRLGETSKRALAEERKPRRASRPAAAVPQESTSFLRLAWEKGTYFAAAAAFSGIALFAQGGTGAVQSFQSYSLGVRLSSAVVTYVLYLVKTVSPQNLAVFYPHSKASLSAVAVAASAAFLLAVSAAAILLVRRAPYLFVGWFWYLGTLVPLIGLVQIGTQGMADRYTYFPLIGIFLAAAWLVPQLVPPGFLREKVLPAAVLAGLALLALTSYSQVSYWHDSITLFRHSKECTPDNSVAHEYLAGALLAEGEYREAATELRAAIRMAPHFAPLYANLGAALDRLGRHDEAVEQYRAALAIEEHNAEIHSDFGTLLVKREKFSEARREFERAVELDPGRLVDHLNLAALALRATDYAAAKRVAEGALQIDPGLALAQVYVALALEGQGHADEAIRRIEGLLKRDPENPLFRDQLARLQAARAASKPPSK